MKKQAPEGKIQLTINVKNVLEKRYLLRDRAGKIIESPSQMFKRVAKTVAAVDKTYDKKVNVGKTEKEFLERVDDKKIKTAKQRIRNRRSTKKKFKVQDRWR